LIVGDSVRSSLSRVALQRLGNVHAALIAPQFFNSSLSDGVSTDVLGTHVAPAILLPGGATHATSGARVTRIQLCAVDERFWDLGQQPAPPSTNDLGRGIALNMELATELGAIVGDDVLIRFVRPATVSPDTLLGRADQTTLTRRLTVKAIVQNQGMGQFSLAHGHKPPRNAFLALETMQRFVDRPDQANALLARPPQNRPEAWLLALQTAVQKQVGLPDLGLRLRVSSEYAYASLESSAFLLPPAVGRRIETGNGILSYLANDIRSPESGRTVPYSIVAALDPAALKYAELPRVGGGVVDTLSAGEILLNQWAAEDLGVHPGDDIELEYYINGPFGRIDTHTERLTLKGVVDMRGPALDPGFTTDYPGVTDTTRISDWDPPFPVDLTRVRDRDETYWDDYRTAPKAYVTLADGQRMWAHDAERFGGLTAFRWPIEQVHDVNGHAAAIIEQVEARHMGLTFEDVRAHALDAARGSTDFGGLFIGFSFFLIASGALLIALLFRLNVERRARELGLLLALGFRPRTIAWSLLAEGGVISVVGAAIGAVAAIGYADAMLAGLRSWWSAAVNAPFLELHVTPLTVAGGVAGTVAVSLMSIAVSVKGHLRSSPRRLLSGAVQAPRQMKTPSRFGLMAGFIIATGATATITASAAGAVPQTIGFFLGGAGWLTALGLMARHALRRPNTRQVTTPGLASLVRLGRRNASRHPQRSMAIIASIGCASFLITALGAFKLTPEDTNAEDGGSGGFEYVAEATLPLQYDPGSTEGRSALGIPETPTPPTFDLIPMRLRPGDETSCRNLYVPTRHRIVAAPQALISRGGFSFHSTLEDNDNPWALLNTQFDDGAIAAIGDESAVRWQLHSGLGRDLEITDDHGTAHRLRFVALLKGSILQDELILSDASFVELFPKVSGHAFLLVDSGASPDSQVAAWLERELAPFELDVVPARERLAEYMAVQNTYLSTFQTLGGLGLVLGICGLGAVVMRNIIERRSELAVMQACGFSRLDLATMVLAENATLVAIGFGIGVIPALIAIAPHVINDAGALPWLSLALTLGGCGLAGALIGVITLMFALRTPIVHALRCE
jgi:hypothetical protein